MYQPNNPSPVQYSGNSIIPGSAPHIGNQPLTNEQIEMLRAEVNKADWRVSDVDLLKAQCTHKFKDGTLSIVEGSDDKVKCSICGEEFHMLNDDLTTIQSHVEYVLDALQTTKAIYLDIPNQLAKNYYQMIPMLKKLTMLYHKAAENMNQYSNSQQSATIYGNNFAYNPNSWDIMNSISAGNSYNGFNTTPAPGFVNQNGQFVQNPSQPQAIMQNGQWFVPANTQQNGNWYNPMTGGVMPAQSMNQQPAAPQQVNVPPVQAQQPAAPQQVNVPPVQAQQPAAPQQVTQTKTFNV